MPTAIRLFLVNNIGIRCRQRACGYHLEHHHHALADAEACGYHLEHHHHALADAEACAWIARELL